MMQEESHTCSVWPLQCWCSLMLHRNINSSHCIPANCLEFPWIVQRFGQQSRDLVGILYYVIAKLCTSMWSVYK